MLGFKNIRSLYMKTNLFTYIFIALSFMGQMVFVFPAHADNNSEQTPQVLAKLIPKEAPWSLQFPKDDLVVYKGKMNFDTLGTNQQGMLYPAAGAAGFLAALITHGIISESTKSHQKTKAEEAADKVLLPYQSILSEFHQKQLMQSGLEQVNQNDKKRMLEFGGKTGADWFIESVPVFSMTQDQRAIILENHIAIFTQKSSTAPVYQNTIKVISQVKNEDDLVNFWTANQGEKLKEESVNLFGHSLNMILGEIAIDSESGNIPYKTFRYIEGAHEKMERGQFVSENCNRIVIKTLRGELMSIPKKLDTADSKNDHCS
ncbi:MAG: hypothetical protein ACXU7H_05270 [Burkholderiaceae bacterium]